MATGEAEKDVSVVEDAVVEQVGTPNALEVSIDSQKAIARISAVSQVLSGCAKASIQRTNPQDWVKMGASYYLQATGAEKIRAVWGIYYRDRKIAKEIHEDGSYSYLVTGVVGSKVLDQLYGEVTIEIDGGRSSSDPFFTKNNRDPDPLDVRKAALANWEARAIAALLGLKNMTADDLKANGIDVGKITGVEYQRGAEGGGQASVVISEAQRKRLYAISKTANVSEGAMKGLLQVFGFATSEKITRDKYEAICAVVEAGPDAVVKKTQELLKARAAASATREPGEDDGSPEASFNG